MRRAGPMLASTQAPARLPLRLGGSTVATRLPQVIVAVRRNCGALGLPACARVAVRGVERRANGAARPCSAWCARQWTVAMAMAPDARQATA